MAAADFLAQCSEFIQKDCYRNTKQFSENSSFLNKWQLLIYLNSVQNSYDNLLQKNKSIFRELVHSWTVAAAISLKSVQNFIQKNIPLQNKNELLVLVHSLKKCHCFRDAFREFLFPISTAGSDTSMDFRREAPAHCYVMLRRQRKTGLRWMSCWQKSDFVWNSKQSSFVRTEPPRWSAFLQFWDPHSFYFLVHHPHWISPSKNI